MTKTTLAKTQPLIRLSLVSQLYLATHVAAYPPAGFIAPCLPTKTSTPPSGALWLHEIKHDGHKKKMEVRGSARSIASRSVIPSPA